MTDGGSNSYELCAGAEAFMSALRAEATRCASSLWVQFTTFEGDASGSELAELMIEKVRQGVDVRFLVDHYSDVIANDILPIVSRRRAELRHERDRTSALLAQLRDNGVHVKRTAPVGRLCRYLLHRDHKKMVVLDGRVAFVGGLNISDHNFAWRDFMVKIAGPLVDDLASDYSATWTGTSRDAVHPALRSRDFVVTTAPGRDAIGAEVLSMIRHAQQSVAIESPSLLGRHIERALLDAARRGVEIELVAPSRHNRAIFRVWVAGTFGYLWHPNIAIYRHHGTGGMTHAKLLIVDDQVATFGSFNFFELEAITQKELNVFTSDPALVASIRAYFDGAVAASSEEPPPRRSFGRFSYTLVVAIVDHWTRRLLRNPRWKAQYA